MNHHRNNLSGLIVASFAVFALCAQSFAAERPVEWGVAGQGNAGIQIVRDGVPIFALEKTVFDAWSWGRSAPGDGLRAQVRDGIRVFEEKKTLFGNEKSGLDQLIEISQTGEGSMQIRTTLTSAEPAAFHMPWDGNFGLQAEAGRKVYGFGYFLPASSYFSVGSCRVEFASGEVETIPLPPPSGWGKENIVKLELATDAGETVTMAFSPPIAMHCDHGTLRLFVQQRAEAGQAVIQDIVLKLPSTPLFEPDNPWVDTSEWLVLEHGRANDVSPGSVLGMEDWLEKPAGKRGWVQMAGNRFVLEDGSPIKFFGVNISWSHMACPREQADQWNDRWAKYGVNLVRLHKFIDSSWAGIMTDHDHSVPDPEKILLFDYYHASARKRGIYTAWSPVFHMKVRPADQGRVRHYDEIMANDKQGDVLMLKTLAPDIQDLLIDRVVKMLRRTNEVTGLRYADDPALAYIELQNEDDIFFEPNNFASVRERWPRYYLDFQVRFNDFLREKYGSQEALEKAWGVSYPEGEKLADNSIRTWYTWWNGKQKLDPRQLDTVLFLYQEQSAFYHRFVQAIRDTGYEGAIHGSCWQGWGWHGHLLNMLTDYEVGFIDRHNYAPTLLDRPGSGLFSAGYQQVKDRPFNLSEWGGGPDRRADRRFLWDGFAGVGSPMPVLQQQG